MLEIWWLRIRTIVNKAVFSKRGNRLVRYGLPLLLSLLVFTTKTYILPILGERSPFSLSVLVVILSAFYGGFGPGILATVLGAIFNYFLFLELKGEFLIQALVFILTGALVSIIAEARKQAESQKDEFIGIVSHELKNPLAVVKVYANLIYAQAKKKGENKLQEFASHIDA